MVESKWHGVRLPEGLVKEIEKTMEKHPHWSSKADFVKDAVRQLLNYYRSWILGKGGNRTKIYIYSRLSDPKNFPPNRVGIEASF